MKRWMKYVKPYAKYFILGPLLMIVEVIGEVVMPKFFANIINGGVANQNPGYVITMGIIMVVASLLMIVGGVGGCYFGAKASINFGADVRRDVFTKVQSFGFSNIDKFSTGSLVTRLTNDVTQIQNFTNMLLRMCLRTPGMLIGALYMAIRLNARLALVLAVIMPVMVIVMAVVMKTSFPKFTRMQAMVDGLNVSVQENLTNIRVVKSFVREDYEEDRFRTANGNLKAAGMDAIGVIILMMPVMTLFMNLASMAVIWFGGRMVLVGSMPLGDLTAFITYITQILSSLMMLSMIFMSASRAVASSKRLGEVLDEQVDLSDENAASKDKLVESGRIEFKNVGFRY